MKGDDRVGLPKGLLHFLPGQHLSNNPLMVFLALYRVVQSRADNSQVITILVQTGFITKWFELLA